MEDLTNNTKKIRVTYSDPDATDSSSDESESPQKKSKRKVHEVVVVVQKVKFADKIGKLGPISGRSRKPTGKTKFVGVRRRLSGKYAAEIRDSVSKKRIWLGTFTTAEEASRVYLSKKREIEKKLRAKRGFDWVPCEKPPSSQDSPSSVLEDETFESADETRRRDAAPEEEVSGEEKAAFLFGVRILDRNGFLVGEFSKLDDLSICAAEQADF